MKDPAVGSETPAVLECKITANRYGTYCVPASSAQRPAAQAVLRGQVYEKDTIAFMTAHCGDHDIVHAGTYFGDFLPALSAAISPDAKVWAFEPNSESHRCAEITMLLNRIANVELRHAGLGATSSTSFVQTTNARGRALGGTSRIVSEVLPGATAESVDVVAIDDVVPADRTVGILQLDVEGYEREALTGAFATIRRCRPILVLEQQPSHAFLDEDWFADNVLSIGYELAQRMHLNRVYRPV
ncbi:FkbM family methyltransferase [Nocardioides bizhenqiangii]|uniref:FkbM family methyltransferase n=1 Tax=Nocardioides bizhenqiangii TaxID=3095076 RepID=A0ABZ0ZLL9_9ACTN|nr:MULTISPECIES: FkbM family methyltransferase [unclassified Nocardioides]MDZ5620796.1 FkbM family methyltransferase [Nocardioides sp. HM23]WQQ25160.1 FkbM family methyltransferase [Nocardioides sp. HM61]